MAGIETIIDRRLLHSRYPRVMDRATFVVKISQHPAIAVSQFVDPELGDAHLRQLLTTFVQFQAAQSQLRDARVGLMQQHRRPCGLKRPVPLAHRVGHLLSQLLDTLRILGDLLNDALELALLPLLEAEADAEDRVE